MDQKEATFFCSDWIDGFFIQQNPKDIKKVYSLNGFFTQTHSMDMLFRYFSLCCAQKYYETAAWFLTFLNVSNLSKEYIQTLLHEMFIDACAFGNIDLIKLFLFNSNNPEYTKIVKSDRHNNILFEIRTFIYHLDLSLFNITHWDSYHQIRALKEAYNLSTYLKTGYKLEALSCGEISLYSACLNNQTEVVAVLCCSCPDDLHGGYFVADYFDMALKHRNFVMMEILLNYGNVGYHAYNYYFDLILNNCISGDFEVVKFLVTHEKLQDELKSESKILLEEARKRGHKEIIKLLKNTFKKKKS
jgi:hypothetical protein